MDQFMRGVVATGCGVIGLFFLRFFYRDRDRLFLFFAISFFLLAADRVVLALGASIGSTTDVPYWIRAFAYVLIIVAIIDKNVSKPESSSW